MKIHLHVFDNSDIPLIQCLNPRNQTTTCHVPKASHAHKRFAQWGSSSHVFGADLMQAVWHRRTTFAGL